MVESPNVPPNVLVGRQIRNALYLPTEVLMEWSKPIHLNALLDSGVASSFIHQDIVKQHGFKQKLLDHPVVVGNVDGSDNQGGWIRKYVILPILCAGKKKSYERFLIGNIGHEFMILGYDWIRDKPKLVYLLVHQSLPSRVVLITLLIFYIVLV